MLIPVALFYLLMDWDRFVAKALEFVPPRLRGAYDSFTQEADVVLGQYLRGQLLVMLALSVFYSVGLSLWSGPGLANWRLYRAGRFCALCGVWCGTDFGHLGGFAGICRHSGAFKAMIMVAVVFGLGQIIEGFFLTPRLVGERIGLHPLAVIFALLAFGQLFGFVGVLVALPASAVLLVAMRRARDQLLVQ